MLLLSYIPRTKECLGYFTPDVFHWCQTAAGLHVPVLNSLQLYLRAVLHGLQRNTGVQAWAISMRWLTSAMIARRACAWKTSSLRCLASRLPMPCGWAGNILCCKTPPWVFGFFSDWVVLVLGSFCWEQGVEKTKNLAQAATTCWCRKARHL